MRWAFLNRAQAVELTLENRKKKGCKRKKAIHGFCSGVRETESRRATALSYKLQRRRKILNAGYSRDVVLILIRSLTVDVMIIIDELLVIEHQRHILLQKESPIHL